MNDNKIPQYTIFYYSKDNNGLNFTYDHYESLGNNGLEEKLLLLDHQKCYFEIRNNITFRSHYQNQILPLLNEGFSLENAIEKLNTEIHS